MRAKRQCREKHERREVGERKRDNGVVNERKKWREKQEMKE